MIQFDGISKEAATLLNKLHKAANDEQAVCQSAPIIWDGENLEDIQTAKRGCNGVKAQGENLGYPPCPLRELCLETALALNANYGVWGGLSVHERKLIRRSRRQSS
jgi:hypothetical protein